MKEIKLIKQITKSQTSLKSDNHRENAQIQKENSTNSNKNYKDFTEWKNNVEKIKLDKKIENEHLNLNQTLLSQLEENRTEKDDSTSFINKVDESLIEIKNPVNDINSQVFPSNSPHEQSTKLKAPHIEEQTDPI